MQKLKIQILFFLLRMKKVTGIKLENDTIYLMKRPKYGIDDLIGFNPNCI